MKNNKRFSLSEITANRLFSAAIIRFKEIPHSIAWFVDPFAKQNREKIDTFRGIHQGERCFLIANGPSLKNTDLDLLKNEYSFGLNRIYLNFQRTSFRPTYFVSINELILEQFHQEISQLQIPKFLNWNRRSYFESTNTLYLKSKLVFSDFFQQDLTQPMVFGATVTFVALQLAFFMGFQKVIIVGLDHDFIDKGTPNKTKIRNVEIDENHFDPQYFPKGTKWQLPDLARSNLDYTLARNAFELDNREIVDATIGGKCDIFKKVDYLSLFN